MSHVAYTMPEAKFRKTKKGAQSFRNSEFAHESRTFRALAEKQSKAKAKAAAAPATPAAAPKAAPPTLEALTLAPAPTKARKKAKDTSLLSWWPVGVAVFLTGFAPQWWEMANQFGIWMMRATFPLVLLASRPDLGFTGDLAHRLPELALFLQIPIEGLLTKLTLDRGNSIQGAVIQLLLIHAVSVGVLYLLSLAGS
jgi:hypothetical protein